ncbi:MAG: hypothetical protein ACP5PQ_02995 [Thermoproteota archaeon]
MKYEEGEDFSEDDWAREDYVNFNEAYAGCNIEVLDNGDIMFPVAANVAKCCGILGIDVNDVFPSCPRIMHGLIVFRGSWSKMERACFRQFFRRLFMQRLTIDRKLGSWKISARY